MKLIDKDHLEDSMYHEAFETDTGMQKWDSGCWIRYKLFENILDEQKEIEAIPIRWLESWIHKQYNSQSDNARSEIEIWEMVEDWRTENK